MKRLAILLLLLLPIQTFAVGFVWSLGQPATTDLFDGTFTNGGLSPAADSAANDATVGTITWSNTSNALALDASTATAALSGSAGEDSQYLFITDYDFALPTGATVVGIKVEIQKSRNVFGTVSDNSVRLLKAGALVGDDKADTVTDWNFPATNPTPYGSASDMWGTTWTQSDIENSGFGIAISANKGSGTASLQAFIDAALITVYYTTSLTETCTQRYDWSMGQPAVVYDATAACAAPPAASSGGAKDDVWFFD